MLYAHEKKPIHFEDDFIRVGGRFGVKVFCSVCGKNHKRLEKKFSKVLANTFNDTCIDEFINEHNKIVFKLGEKNGKETNKNW